MTTTTTKGYKLGARGAHNISYGGQHPHLLPKFTSKKDERNHVLEHLCGAFRVFARRGFDEGEAGHISVRDPINPNTFWMNPLGIHFQFMIPLDLVHIDITTGEFLNDGSKKPINKAGLMIHSNIYKHRTEVKSISHAHSVYGKLFSAFGRELDMINQDVCIFYKRQCVFKNFGGVALESDEGTEIAFASQGKAAVILQNHGLLTVGETVDEAAYLFCLLEKSCQVQLLVDSCNVKQKPHIIPDDVAEYSGYVVNDPETMYASFQPDYEREVKLSQGEFLITR